MIGSAACFSAIVVNDMLHLAFSAEVHGQWCHKRIEQPSWDRNAALNMHSVVSKVVIDPNTEGFVGDHVVMHAVAHVAIISIGLSYVVGELRLVEISLPIIARPIHQVFQGVLHSKTIHGHVSSGDLKTCITRVHLGLDNP